VAVVGRFLLEEPRNVRVVVDGETQAGVRAHEQRPSFGGAIERSVARARRITEARMRLEQLRTRPA
jgi:hypothetical protein